MGAALVPIGVPVLMLRGKVGKWHLPVCSWRVLSECCLSGTHFKMSKSPFHCMLQALFRSLFLGFLSMGCLPAFSPRAAQCPLQAVSQTSPLVFKTPGFKSHWLQEIKKFILSHFPSKMLWEFISFCTPLCASPFLTFSLTPGLPTHCSGHNLFFSHHWISAPSSFLNVASSLPFVT